MPDRSAGIGIEVASMRGFGLGPLREEEELVGIAFFGDDFGIGGKEVGT